MIEPELSRTWAMLPGAEGTSGAEDSLDGIDDEQPGFDLLNVAYDSLQRGFAENEQIGRGYVQAFGAHFYLTRRFFARNIKASESFLAYRRKGLQQQRRFSDTGIAADQNDRSRNEAAAQYSIELADSTLQSAFFRRIDFMNRRWIFFGSEAEFTANACCLFEPLFREGIPLIAVGTFAHPFRRLVAAALAGINCFRFCHKIV